MRALAADGKEQWACPNPQKGGEMVCHINEMYVCECWGAECCGAFLINTRLPFPNLQSFLSVAHLPPPFLFKQLIYQPSLAPSAKTRLIQEEEEKPPVRVYLSPASRKSFVHDFEICFTFSGVKLKPRTEEIRQAGNPGDDRRHRLCPQRRLFVHVDNSFKKKKTFLLQLSALKRSRVTLGSDSTSSWGLNLCQQGRQIISWLVVIKKKKKHGREAGASLSLLHWWEARVFMSFWLEQVKRSARQVWSQDAAFLQAVSMVTHKTETVKAQHSV